MFQHAAAGVEELELSSAVYNTFGSRPPPLVHGAKGRSHPTTPTPHALPVGDVIELGELLRVAGVSLDDAAVSMSGVNRSEAEPPRYSGLTLRVTVIYDNAGYHYTVRANPIEAKVVSASTALQQVRHYQDLHGVNILFTQAGGPGYFDLQTLILTLVAGFALLASVKTVANFCLMYVLPRKDDCTPRHRLEPDRHGTTRARHPTE